MKRKLEHIKVLLDRFFEGQTSGKEERELYRFFRQDNIPEELEGYKPVIQYFEYGLANEFRVPLPSKRKLWIVWSSVAASFLLILFSSLYFFKTVETPDPFEGSYIIRNGECITDLNIIRPELEATIQKVLLQEQETEKLIEHLTKPDNSVEIKIIQEMQKHYKRILDNIQDEEIRNEVAKILYTNF